MSKSENLPPKVKDITGQRFARLLVLEFSELRPRGKNRQAYWRCKCDCGLEVFASGIEMRFGRATSCGCRLAEIRAAAPEMWLTHGHAQGSPKNFSGAYRSYRSMRQRCKNPKSISWRDYGGRGITVCERWDASFSAFLEDMGDRPEGGSLERIDPNGNYEPGNCKWIPNSEQARNTRVSRYVILSGERMIQAEAARRLKVKPQVLDGWRKHPHCKPADLDLELTT